MPDLPAPVFRLPVRVYWEDTDAGGVVFYANYLRFFERARTEWLRSLGYEQERWRRQSGIGFVVTDTSVRYRCPARLDDLLDITVTLARAGQASLSVVQQAWRAVTSDAPQLLVEGTIRIGCVTLGTFKPCRIPSELLHCIR
jgi:acyl-CoA thioester hydrolase